MVVETLKRWLPETLEREVESLCEQMQSFSGYRTIWLDDEGGLWHAEPDEMLEELGHEYVGTFFRPAASDVCDALAKRLPVRTPSRVCAPLPTPGFVRVGALVPA